MTIFSNIDLTVKKKQGDLGVARAIYEYTRLGYVVFFPLSDTNKYDLVIDDGNGLKRVEVKTSRGKLSRYKGREDHKGWVVMLRTNGGNTKKYNTRFRQPDDYDVLFVLVETGECWSIPVSALANVRNSIVVGTSKYNEFKLVV